MKDFADLIIKLDSTTGINNKVNALVDYFEKADQKDIVWTIALLSGRRPKRSINTTRLREIAASESKIPLWLFEESYHIVGDLAETVSLVLQENDAENTHSLDYWINYLHELKDLEELDKEYKIKDAWQQMDQSQRFVFNKLITGGFRIGVSQKLMTRALAKFTGLEENILTHRLMGNWDPFSISLDELINPEDSSHEISKPYPFYLAYALETEPTQLGEPNQWYAERKWDGIRGQIVIREGQIFIWSRGEELVTDKFPELLDLPNCIPDGTVLDGEIVAFDEVPLDFQLLQTRIGRKNVSKSALKKAPVSFIAYDIMEMNGEDLRAKSQEDRRRFLERIIESTNHNKLLLSELVPFSNWNELKAEREESSRHFCEGLMLKKKDGIYKTGRKRGEWWKWKVDPFTVDAILIYAMRGHGRRANLYTDYTFAVWDEDQLVPFTKAYSGLTDEEFRSVDNFVKRNTIERFGPVRSVKPELVFEIAFEGISRSTRHKSGVALRFPRMSRWRKDKKPEEANTKNDLLQLIRVRK